VNAGESSDIILRPFSPVEPHILDIAYRGRPMVGTVITKAVGDSLVVAQLVVDEPGVVSKEFLSSLTNALGIIAKKKGLSNIKIEYLPQHLRMYELAGFTQSYEEGEAGMVVKHLTENPVRYGNEEGESKMPKTEPERKSFHERIFGKGSTPPLERFRRGETANNLLPMSPEEGPPLPRVLAIKWPWKK